MSKISSKLLRAMGFKEFIKDAEPEEIAKAMDELGKEEPKKSYEEPEKKEGKDEEGAGEMSAIIEKLNALLDRIEKLESREEAQKESSDEDEVEKVLDTAEEIAEKKEANDSGIVGFVKDMRPVIMAIQDEKQRLKAANAFRAAIKDSKSGSNGYQEIIKTVTANRMKAMDNKSNVQETRGEQAANAWNKRGKEMSGGKQ